MRRRNAFWGQFWSEAGRNTGKWMSNKVFGNAGWATPRRHINHLLDDDDGEIDRTIRRRRGVSKRHRPDPDNAIEAHSDPPVRQDSEKDRLMDWAKSIRFESDRVHDIAGTMDDLFTGANKAQAGNYPVTVFTSKIQSGIVRLERIGEYGLASHYREELKRLNRRSIWNVVSLALVIVLMIGTWLLFQFYAQMMPW